MTVKIQEFATPLPSSILHNGRAARAHYTRLAAQMATAAILRHFRTLGRQLRRKGDWGNPPMPEA